MVNFKKEWIKEKREPLSDRIKKGITPSGPLRPKIDQVGRSLEGQIANLGTVTRKLKEKENMIFDQLVESNEKRDVQRSNILANELSQIRKTSMTIQSSSSALEQLSMRMKTIQDIGDVAVALSPAFKTIRKIQSSISGIVPQATNEFNEMGAMVGELMMEAGQVSESPMNFETNSEEAEKIIAEASAMAEKKMKQNIPGIPSEEELEESDSELNFSLNPE